MTGFDVYTVVAFIWSMYQGARGVDEQRLHAGEPWFDKMTWKRRFFLLYLHDFAFRFICTAAGFLALAIGKYYAEVRMGVAELTGGDATLLIACFLIGVVGVGGQLHYVILLGKVPSKLT